VEHWQTLLTRMVDGERGGFSRADYRLVKEYFSKEAIS
jgi:hypothetical protein